MFTLSIPSYRPVTVATLEAAQDAYIHRREQSGLGASRFGFGTVTNETTGETFSVSYNGRVWQGDLLVQEMPR